MKKILFNFIITVAFSFFTFYSATASHLAGWDFTYLLVDSAAGNYHYRVSLSIYQDCLNGQPQANAQDNPAFLAVYGPSGALLQMDSVSYSSADSMPVSSFSPCNSSTMPFCRRKVTFTKDYFLPASSSGYIVVYQRCCMNNMIVDIDNPGDIGMAAFCMIPSSDITTHNNSAVFTNYPPFIIPLNVPLVFDCSATDADGDSLSYGFCAASIGADDASIKPWPPPPPDRPAPLYYDSVTYIYPFNSQNPVSSSPQLQINPVTGLMAGTPNHTGCYLVVVYCSEWRGGVLINTVRREFEFTVADCTSAVPSLSVGETLTLYPNPAYTELTISAGNNIRQISIINLLGQIVFNHEYDKKPVLVSVADFPNGVYFVKINGTEMRKFVKE